MDGQEDFEDQDPAIISAMDTKQGIKTSQAREHVYDSKM